MTDDEGGRFVDRAKAKVKQTAGSLLGDDTLAREGMLEQEKAKAAEQAAEEAYGADLLEKRADVEAAKQRNTIERQRIDAEEIEAALAAQVERDGVAAGQQVEAELSEKQQAERRRQAAQDQAIVDQDVVADRQHVAEAAEAALRATQADRAAAAAERIEDLRPGG